jgi:hypothetical protein
MPRMMFAGSLGVALLSVLLPGKTVAGPPDGASGRMVLDEVADGLRRYRQAKEMATRIAYLKRLALTRDPRVGVALWEAQGDPSLELCLAATRAFAQEFARGERARAWKQAADAFEARIPECEALGIDAREMWRHLNGCGLLDRDEADSVKDLYRRAAELPQYR